MWLQVGAFALGLVGLYFGAEWLVRGAARLARSLGISALIVGLTVVAFGTSAPELLVSLLAAFREQPGVAVGNVVGSNIANIALILGISALICPMRAESKLILREMPIMVAASLALALFGYDGAFSRGEGVVLLAGLMAYLWLMVAVSKRASSRVVAEFTEFQERERQAPHGESRLTDVGLVLIGLAVLAGGAHLLVTAAVYFARALGVSDLMIGLTVVAIGTSLPELATSVVAAWRREADIALGNIVGSNIFNVLAILGTTALLHPLVVEREMYGLEIPVMMALSLLLPLFGWTQLRVDRWEGAVLLSVYVGFTAWLIAGVSLGA